MENNNSFCWKTYEISIDHFYNETNNEDFAQNKRIKADENDKINKKIENNIQEVEKQIILNETYFNEKLNKAEKYNFDLGAFIINANNNILCFNKNNINKQSNSYFKVDHLIFDGNKFVASNIYNNFTGPRYRVTSVNMIV